MNRYKFSHRANGRYYWTRPSANGVYEEQVSCNVLWFWGWTSTDSTLPPCDCRTGYWGATGLMPDNNHCLVITKHRQYLAHRRTLMNEMWPGCPHGTAS
jgi:hypothetical protein